MRAAHRCSRRELIAAALLGWSGARAAQRAGAGAARPTASSDLITKPIPSTGERLPAIGLGTDAFYRSEQAAIQAEIERMVQLGGRVIDTSADYGDSEELIGEALAALRVRERVFLATKLTASGGGFFGLGGGLGGQASFERSLRRLRTSRVELLQVHNLDGVDALMPSMQRWKQAGQVRYLGVTTSERSKHHALLEFMRRYPLDFIQVDYSIANRDAETAIFPGAIERRIAVLVNLPFGQAALFRAAQGRQLPSWAAELGVSSWGQYFLKYVISHPAVTCAIPGSTRVSHMEDNQQAGRGVLPDASMREQMERYWRG